MHNLPIHLSDTTLLDLTHFIQIRNYVVNAINNFTLPKDSSNHLNKMLVMLDRRIVELLLSEDFKKLLGYEDLDKIMAEVIKNNNIKSGMKPHQ
jgi:hypothetical protein